MSRVPTPRTLARAVALLLPLVVLPALGAGSSSAQRSTDPSVAADEPGVVDSLFTPLDGFSLAARDGDGNRATVRPTEFSAFRLDLAGARDQLTPAAATAGPVEFSVPDPSGTPVTFSVVEQSVMEPALQAAHPEIRTYTGQADDGTGRSISLGVTRLGFFASVRAPGGGASWYVDPAYQQTSAADYVSYYGAAVPDASPGLVERGPVDTAEILAAAPSVAQRPAANTPVTLRTFRMAFVTDPTYATYFGTANVLSAKATLIARADQIYNDDLAVRFVLINDTDRLNLDTQAKASGANGPCGANACYPATVYSGNAPTGCDGDGTLIARNEFVLGQIIGADNYDIGHIGLGVNGGGIAGLGVVGGGSKSSGCTGLLTPTGDFYAVDYFAHEVGHQVGGDHTFDGNQVNCASTNRNGSLPGPSTAVEPGSGSTVMAYAGICGQDNLQPHSDPYFSQRSIDEIDAVVTAAPTTVTEVQTVSLAGFDTDGETVQLTYPGATPQTLTRGATTYNTATITTAVQNLTGCLAQVAGYDGATAPSGSGFRVTFGTTCAGQDERRLGIGTTSAGVTGFVGVQDNGGPTTNQGSTTLVTANHAPQVSAPADKTIPVQTPFTLSGGASDVDGGPLTYLWEQNDAGGVNGTALVANSKAAGALFRVFGTYADVSSTGTLTTPSPGENLATGDATRTFPDLAQVLSGNTNAATGTCPTAPAVPAGSGTNVPRATVDCFSEFLPTAAYGNGVQNAVLHFRLTARDNAAVGGGTQYDDVALTVDRNAGPFLVTSRPTAGMSATGGSTETVTWSVAGTNAATLAPNVAISLSTDGGSTFTPLLATTPNDGSQDVTLPNVATSAARLKVEAVGNYFFDVNDAPFTITAAAAPASPALATRTRIRLPRVEQLQGRESTPLHYAVVSSRASGGRAGRVVIRVDGRKVRSAPVSVVRKHGKKVTGGTYRLSRKLDLGKHRITIRFKPTDPAAYRGSHSRPVTLTVVRRR